MRKPFIAGNWKMNKNLPEAKQLAINLKNKLIGISDVTIAVCPTAVSLDALCQILKDSNIFVGAQNMYFEESGAYTGELSPDMVLSTGAKYVIIGHSERRQYFGETDESVNKKVKLALKTGLLPIMCIGETLEQRESGVTKEVVKTQIDGGLEGLTSEDMSKITIAYEPIWAIGTGKTATPDQAEEVHEFIRNLIKEKYDEKVSDNLIIQYGGSVKPSNVKELMAQPDIDGALVGGASLDADSFSQLIKFDN